MPSWKATTSCEVSEVKLQSVAKGWSNNLGGTLPKGLTGLITLDGGPKTQGEGGLSTLVTPTVRCFVSGESEGGELRWPFFFFTTGLNGMSGELPPAVSMSSQTIQQCTTVVTVNPLKVTPILAWFVP